MNVYRNRKAKIWDLEEAYQKKMQAIRDVKNRMSGESYARSLFIDKRSASSAMGKPSAFCTSVRRSESADK